MVKDDRFSKPRRKRMNRGSSWKDLFRDLASGDKEPDTSSGSRVRPSLFVSQSSNKRSMSGEEIPYDAAEDSDNDKDGGGEDEFGHQKEADWPISARVRYANLPAAMTRTGSTLGHESSAALVSSGTAEIPEDEGLNRGKQPIGTRLTMTSRTGYFQDRIVAPSMVCSSSSAAASR